MNRKIKAGRWLTRNGSVQNVEAQKDPAEHDCPWCSPYIEAGWNSEGRYFDDEEHPLDLITYIGPVSKPTKFRTVEEREIAIETLNHSAKALKSIQKTHRQLARRFERFVDETEDRIDKANDLISRLTEIVRATRNTKRWGSKGEK